MVACHFSYLQCNEINTFGDDAGCAHARFVIAQCHGIVRRVDDDEVRFGNLQNTLALGDLPLERPPSVFCFRVTFGFFVLFPNLLLRHLELRLVQTDLHRHIDRSHGSDDQQHHAQAGDHPVAGGFERGLISLQGQRRHLLQMRVHVNHDHHRQDGDDEA